MSKPAYDRRATWRVSYEKPTRSGGREDGAGTAPMKRRLSPAVTQFCVRSLIAGVGLLVACALWWVTAYDNYHTVLQGELYRSGQMGVKRLLAHAARDPLATVINLRPETDQAWHTAERAACTSAGIAYIDFPLAGDRAPTPEAMSALVEIMRTAPRPLLIHCEHGADRTGLAVALYLRSLSGRPVSEARRALSIRYGHTPYLGMGCFDRAFAEYCLTEDGRAAQRAE